MPFEHKLTIELTGEKNHHGYVFDPALVGNKIFVVTGKLHLYGATPNVITSRLTSIARAGDTQITLSHSVEGDWAVGD